MNPAPCLLLRESCPLITLLDNCLTGYGYHMATHARAVLDAFPEARVWAHRDCTIEDARILPVFTRSLAAPESRYPAGGGVFSRIGWFKTLRSCNRRYREDLGKARFEKAGDGEEEEVLIMENADPRTVLGAVDWSVARCGDHPHHLVLHFLNPPSRALRFLARRLDRKNARHIHVATDTPEMAEAFQAALGRAAHLLHFPLPDRGDPADPPPPPLPPEGPLVVAMPGGPRKEKGFDIAVDAMGAMEDGLASGALRLVVQEHAHDIGDEGLAPAWKRLLALADEHGGIEVLPAKLSEPDYAAMISGAHVILAPYRSDAYSQRGSWVPIEAIAAGRPVILTEDIQTAADVREHGVGYFVKDGDPASIADAIGRLSDDPAPPLAEALTCADRWRQTHGPENFLAQVHSICEI